MGQSRHRPQAHEFFTGGGIFTANFPLHAVMASFIPPARRLKRMAPLLAAPAALLLNQGQAKAILTYNIFESGTSVVVQASGSLNLTGAQTVPPFKCGFNGILLSSSGVICTGPDPATNQTGYNITGNTSFIGTAFVGPADSVSGIFTILFALNGRFSLDSTYVSSTPIVSSATFNSKTLAGLGFTTTGLIGTWTLNGTNDTIQVVIGAPPSPSAAVPGPLPLLGAGAAFGWSRRLRKRISTSSSTLPQV